MAKLRVVCTEQVPQRRHADEARIVAVGTNEQGGAVATNRWSVPVVVAAIDSGHEFYTYGEQSRKVARVVKYWCSLCGGTWHIKSTPDATTDNNLDSLRFCSWKAA